PAPVLIPPPSPACIAATATAKSYCSVSFACNRSGTATPCTKPALSHGAKNTKNIIRLVWLGTTHISVTVILNVTLLRSGPRGSKPKSSPSVAPIARSDNALGKRPIRQNRNPTAATTSSASAQTASTSAPSQQSNARPGSNTSARRGSTISATSTRF